MATIFQDLQQTFVIVAGAPVLWLLGMMLAALMVLALFAPIFRLLRR